MSTLCSLAVSHGFLGREDDAEVVVLDEVTAAAAAADAAGAVDDSAVGVEGTASALEDEASAVAAAVSV